MQSLDVPRELISKAEFALRRGVTRPRVSQWIAGGKIDGDAVVGTGRHALIDEQLACAQLEQRLDAVMREAHEKSATLARPIAIDREAVREVGRIISTVVEGALPGLATTLASDFRMPPGDVLTRLRRGWRAICERSQ